jgi:hypothetical protein
MKPLILSLSRARESIEAERGDNLGRGKSG